MSLIAGSYERFIWGFRLQSQSQTLTLTQLFSYPSHTSSIACVASAGNAAASGGADDTIHLYNVGAASSLGSLHDHAASVTALSFFTPAGLAFPRNLVSADSDGVVCIYDADPFVLLKSLKVHRRAVNDLAVHPSGAVALTVGRDECLGMLNLVRGRRSFYCRMGREAGLVRYGLAGDKFFMAAEGKVSVHEAEDAKTVCEFDAPRRILCAAPAENGLLFTGGEDRGITAWDTNSGKVAYSVEGAHSSRVKGIVLLTRKAGGVDEDHPFLVASASSDGAIRVWDVRMAMKDEKPNPLAEANTNSRITCLAGSSIKSFQKPRPGNGASKAGNDAALEYTKS